MDNNQISQRAKQVAIIAGVFTAFVSFMLIFNYIQISSSDPLSSKVLESLVKRLSTEPNNQELITEIRQFDLLARKAYFNSLWQIKMGAYLLIFGAIVLVVSLRSYLSINFKIDKPSQNQVKGRVVRLKTERWIAVSGAALVILALSSAFFTTNHIKEYQQVYVSNNEVDDGIERLEIRAIQVDKNETSTVIVESVENDKNISTEKINVAESNAIETDELLLNVKTVWQNHNSFRGPFGNAVSKHKNIPVDWNGQSGKNILWKIKIPIHGYNSPVIWGDKLFFSGANQSKRVVYCYNRNTGKPLWEREVNNIEGSPTVPPKTTEDTGLAAPTLTVDGKRVYALFGTGDIIAFDLEGNRVWARNLGVPNNHYGHSSSLIMWENKLFVQYDTHSGCKVLALDVTTGKTVWETNRSNDVSWASPILAEVNGKMQLILLSNPDFNGYDISNGKLLWSVKCMSGEVGPSPAFGNGLVYAANEYANMVAVNPITGKEIWQNRYYLPEVSSILYHDKLIYMATTFAVVACFDAASGEFIWEFDANDSFYSSPMLADGKIYVFDTNGKAYIFNPGREPKLIASPELGEKVFATPVFADGRIYIRGNEHIYCIGTK
jgi:outer membrane protein assembly factor BamB